MQNKDTSVLIFNSMKHIPHPLFEQLHKAVKPLLSSSDLKQLNRVVISTLAANIANNIDQLSFCEKLFQWQIARTTILRAFNAIFQQNVTEQVRLQVGTCLARLVLPVIEQEDPKSTLAELAVTCMDNILENITPTSDILKPSSYSEFLKTVAVRLLSSPKFEQTSRFVPSLIEQHLKKQAISFLGLLWCDGMFLFCYTL